MIDGNRLLLLNNQKADEEKFMSAWNASGVKNWLNSKKEISIPEITGMVHKEAKATDLTLKYGSKKEKLSFATTSELEELAGILSRTNKLQPDVQGMSKLKATGGWLIGLALTALFGWIMHGYATGEISYSTSGRRRLIGKLLHELAQKMGAELVLITAGAIAAFIVYKIYSIVKNPPNEVVYQ